MKIGIFDSGYGGRYALELCQQQLPECEFVGYFDHEHAPYGDRSAEEIFNLTTIGVNNLFDQNCNLVLLACNTASSQALRRLQDAAPSRKVLGCLIPAIEVALEPRADKFPPSPISVGVLATRHTINTRKYHREAFKINPQAKIFPLATPKLVPWIEAGQAQTEACQSYLHQHVQTLINDHHINTLILGCTHYHVFKTQLQQRFPTLRVVSSAEAQAEKLKAYLKNRDPQLSLG